MAEGTVKWVNAAKASQHPSSLTAFMAFCWVPSGSTAWL
jgi:hypothetical protein